MVVTSSDCSHLLERGHPSTRRQAEPSKSRMQRVRMRGVHIILQNYRTTHGGFRNTPFSRLRARGDVGLLHTRGCGLPAGVLSGHTDSSPWHHACGIGPQLTERAGSCMRLRLALRPLPEAVGRALALAVEAPPVVPALKVARLAFITSKVSPYHLQGLALG